MIILDVTILRPGWASELGWDPVGVEEGYKEEDRWCRAKPSQQLWIA